MALIGADCSGGAKGFGRGARVRDNDETREEFSVGSRGVCYIGELWEFGIEMIGDD